MYKRPAELTKEDKQIMVRLGLMRWSCTCDSYESFLKENNLTLKQTQIRVSSDIQYLKRKMRRHLRARHLRNLSGNGFFKYAEYVLCKGKCTTCANKIACALKVTA
jgi:DnaJ-domain-containing protein 1